LQHTKLEHLKLMHLTIVLTCYFVSFLLLSGASLNLNQSRPMVGLLVVGQRTGKPGVAEITECSRSPSALSVGSIDH
jgi:hypothetical protein